MCINKIESINYQVEMSPLACRSFVNLYTYRLSLLENNMFDIREVLRSAFRYWIEII